MRSILRRQVPGQVGVVPLAGGGVFGTRVNPGQLDEVRREPPVNLQPSQPGAYAPEQGTYIRLPGADFPPAGSIGVDQIGDGSIAPGANAVLVTINIPDNFRFRMAGIGFGADDEVALRFLTWTIRQAGDSTVPGYVGVSSAVGSIGQLSDIFVVIGSSLTVTIVAFSDATAVNTYRFLCRVRGWFWSEKEVTG